MQTLTLARLLAVAAMLTLAGCDGGGDTAVPAASQVTGELTYQRYCFSCHASGISGAPPAHVAEAWRPRLAQGEAILLEHTVNGMPGNGMPPRGMCVQCTDQELLDAIRYMAAPQ